MNTAKILSSADAIKHDTTTRTRLRGRWLWVARVAWIAIAALALIVMAAELPLGWQTFRTVCTEEPCNMQFSVGSARQLEQLGLSVDIGAVFFTLGTVIPGVAMIITGGLVFWHRSDDWLALLVSLWLVTWGAEITSEGGTAALLAAQPAWLGPIMFLSALYQAFFPLVLYLFPNGRLVPRWSRWSLVPFVIALGLVGAFTPVELPDPLQPVVVPIYSALFLSLVGAQVYRYLRISTPAERQQTKWLILGLPPFAIIQIVWFVAIMPWLDQPGAPVLGLLISFPIVSASLLLIPIPIAIGILRYRLWEVDIVINRSLVYGGVTLFLLAVLVAGFFGLRALWQAVLGSGYEVVAAVLPAVFVALIFSPTQRWLRRLVDARLYGIKLDYVGAVKLYGGTRREARKTGGTRTSFGSYTGLTLLGRGGMGEVYRGQHPTLNRSVAIKILPPHAAGDDEAHKRFLREAQTIARLKHPNIVTLHDVGEQDGAPYMVMEFVDGPSLSDLIHQRGRLSLGEALPILTDIASALDYAHQNGIIHRDIKPSNVMIEKITATGRGQSTRAVLMDFGIAKSYAATSKLTATGMIGTLDYISPEQIQGAAEVDHRADIYSFGVMTYQALTGELPFKHNNPGAMVLAHLNQPPPDPRGIARDLPEGAAGAVVRAMSKRPDERFGTAGEFTAALAA